jgi:hypothetical protein
VPLPVVPAGGVSPISGEPGVVLEPPGLPPVMRAMLLDPATGERLSLTREAHPIDAAILRQLRTVFGTGVAVIRDGNKLRKVQKNDTSAQTLIRVELERIFEPFVKAGQVSLDSLDVVAGEAQGYVASAFVSYTNLANGKERTLGPITAGAIAAARSGGGAAP